MIKLNKDFIIEELSEQIDSLEKENEDIKQKHETFRENFVWQLESIEKTIKEMKRDIKNENEVF